MKRKYYIYSSENLLISNPLHLKSLKIIGPWNWPNLYSFFYVLSKSKSVKFSLIESVICLFIDLAVK